MTTNDGIGNGSIPLRIGRLIDATVYGGPYLEVPVGFWGVKMAVEITHPHMVAVDTKDYCVPKVSDLKAGIVKALMAMINEEDVYAGCLGGIGRTGIFLAALAKVQIEYRKTKHRAGRGDDPVLYVRKHFIPHAVETAEQEKYIADLDVSDIVSWLDATQVAMGMGGLTPPRVTAGQTVRTAGPVHLNRFPEAKAIHENAVHAHEMRKPWIADVDKIGDSAFDNFKQDWKTNQCAGTLRALESDSGNPNDLQTQIWQLEEKVTALVENQRVGNKLFNKINDRVSNQSHMINNLQNMLRRDLTKPSIRARIRTWLKDN